MLFAIGRASAGSFAEPEIGRRAVPSVTGVVDAPLGQEPLEAPDDGRAAITFTGFHVFKDGSSRIFLELTRSVSVQVKRAGTEVVYTLEDTRIPVRNNKNPLITKEFFSPVIKAVLASDGADAKLTVTLREAVPTQHRMVRHANGEATLHIDIAPPKASE